MSLWHADLIVIMFYYVRTLLYQLVCASVVHSLSEYIVDYKSGLQYMGV